MRRAPPTAASVPRQPGQSDHRQPLAPATRQNPEPGFFVPRPGGHRQTLAGWQQPERRACRSHRPRQAGRRPGHSGHRATAVTGRQRSPGDSNHRGDSGRYRPSTFQKRAGRWMFSTSRARAKSGAICAGVNPAMPQPISVTRKVISGCCRANRMKSST